VEQAEFSFDEIKGFKTDKVKKVSYSNRACADFSFDIVDCLRSPIVVSSTGWGDIVPRELRQHITLARLFKNMEIVKGGSKEATIPELCAYLMTASLEAPLDEQWARIYMFVAGEYMRGWGKKKEEEIPDFMREVRLDDYDRSELRNLGEWIYRKRREALKQKLKAESK